VIRSTVIIDPDGKVAHHWPKVSASGHAEAVREKLKELQG
jgi:peroxiredoxin Q/BCP